MSESLKAKAFDPSCFFIIALDGPSAVGKGAVGRELAKRLGLEYFGSSLVYRGLAKLCLERNILGEEQERVEDLSLFPEIIEYAKNFDLNNEEIGTMASKIAAYPKVRENLGKHLVKIIMGAQRIIMEGRDIGTAIAPNADLKIFLTARAEVRAERRYKQLKEEGKECIMHEVLDHLKKRDQRDAERDAAPMVPARDALVIDTSDLGLSQVVSKIVDYINS